MKRNNIIGMLGAAWAISIALAGTVASGALAAQPAAPPGPEVCKACHASQYESYLGSVMSAKNDPRSAASAGGCVACHGDGTAHVKAGGGRGVGGIVNPASKSLSADAKNKICLTCHQAGSRINWQGSKHQANDVACTNCHTMHKDNGKDHVRAKITQPEVCFTCHKDKRAEINRPSHHPILEGKVACSDCHNPHGSAGPSLLVKTTLNETCYTCHTEKRGPLLYEHPPVREDCTNCHTPHGSIHTPLLKARIPWLCQGCHQAQFHPSTVYSGLSLPVNPVTGARNFNSAQQVLASGCENCHSQIHGSNHPSGARKTR